MFGKLPISRLLFETCVNQPLVNLVVDWQNLSNNFTLCKGLICCSLKTLKHAVCSATWPGEYCYKLSILVSSEWEMYLRELNGVSIPGRNFVVLQDKHRVLLLDCGPIDQRYSARSECDDVTRGHEGSSTVNSWGKTVAKRHAGSNIKSSLINYDNYRQLKCRLLVIVWLC